MARGGSNPPFRTNHRQEFRPPALARAARMKSVLQQRAEAAAERFRTARKPVERRQRPIHRAGRSPRTPGGAPSQHRAAGIGNARCGLDPGSRRRQDTASRRHRLLVARTNGRGRRRPERHRVLRAPGHVTQRKLPRAAPACDGCRQRSDLRALERRNRPPPLARGGARGTAPRLTRVTRRRGLAGRRGSLRGSLRAWPCARAVRPARL